MLASVMAASALLGLYSGRPGGPEDDPEFRGDPIPGGLGGRLAPRIRLRDAHGRVVDTRALAGRPYAVTFLYTRCPDVCPVIGQEVRQALARMGGAARDVTVLAVSVDPRGDTPRAARRWVGSQRLPANFAYLVGPRRELRPVWRAYFTAPQVTTRPGTSSHTASIWLVDAKGRWRTRYSAGRPVDPRDLAHDLGLLRDEGGR